MTTLTLEKFVFGHLEIPETINFGGEQLEYTHQLPGGARTVDAMGVSWDDVTWTGMFDGITAVYRAKYLQNLMAQGKAVSCTYGDFNYSVLIKSFKGNFQFLPLPYTITLRVIADLTNPITILAPLGYDDAILTDVYKAMTLASLVRFGGVTGAVAAAASALEALSSIAGASNAQIASVTALVTEALGTVSTAINAINGNVF
jgi:hypothetical protein